ncbi:MAG: IPT/TIG domain-containing protein [Acidobacteriota bacterium]
MNRARRQKSPARLVVAAAALATGGLLAASAAATVVSGQVTGPTGQGVAGLDLDFIDRATGVNLVLVNDNTDLLGFYAISVPVGDYDVRFKPAVGDRLVGFENRGVKVQGGSMVLDQVLESGWFVSGRVIDEQSGAVAFLDLDFIDNIGGGVLFTPHDSTDTLGNFQVVVPAGNYAIEFEPAIGPPLVPLRMNVVAVAADLPLGDVTLATGVHLSGNVVAPDATAVENVKALTLDPVTGLEIFNIRNATDLSGHFDVIVVPGSYSMQFLPSQGDPYLSRLVTGVEVPVAVTLPVVDLEAGSVLTGRVRDTLSNVVRGVDLDAISVLSGLKQFTPRDNTDTKGNYAVTVRPGVYDITFDPPPDVGLAPAELFAVDLTTDVSLPDVDLVPGMAVSGQVQDGGGAALAGVNLDFLDLGAGGLEIFTSGDETDAAGAFSVMVPMGVYDIPFSPPALSGAGKLTIPAESISTAMNLGTVVLPSSGIPSPALITPAAGSAAGGTLVSVTGSGFDPGVKVRIGGRVLSQIQRLDAFTVQGFTRAGRAGPATVEVINPGAAAVPLTGTFTYVPSATPVLLGVRLSGPLGTDVLLEWGSTGQASYTIFASSTAALFGDASVVEVRTTTSFLHEGGATTPSSTFYLVQ